MRCDAHCPVADHRLGVSRRRCVTRPLLLRDGKKTGPMFDFDGANIGLVSFYRIRVFISGQRVACCGRGSVGL